MLNLPADYGRPAPRTFSGADCSSQLSAELSHEVTEFSRSEGVTVFMTLLATFYVLLWRYTQQDDIVVGSPIAGRNRAEVEGLIGFFVNTLALRLQLRGDETFRELLHRVREVALGAYAHQDLPFEKLVAELQPDRDLDRNPLFQVMFQFQSETPAIRQPPGLKITSLESSTGTAKFDLSLATFADAGLLHLVMEYSAERLSRPTIERMLEIYSRLLASAVHDADQRIAELPLMS